MALNLKRKRAGKAADENQQKRHHSDDSAEPTFESDETEWEGLGDEANQRFEIFDRSNLDSGRSEDMQKIQHAASGHEMRAIKEASELFKSSSFKLQIDALIPNVRPKESHRSQIERLLRPLHLFLVSIPSISPAHPLDASKSLEKQGVSIPADILAPTRETKWKVGFEPPNQVTLIGSWATENSVKGKDLKGFCADIAVEMPDNLFQEKDYQDGRFFYKRSFYLAVLAAAIRGSNQFPVEVLYGAALNNPRQTTLVLRPRQEKLKKDLAKFAVQVRIIPTLSSSSRISLRRLSPSHSSIRTSVACSEQESKPTPLYNTTLLLSTLPTPALVVTHALMETVPAFRDALTLLRVWANQRGYGEGSRMCVRGFDGKGSFWPSLLGLIVAGEEPVAKGLNSKQSYRKALGRGLSSYQLFKASLDFLATHDFGQNAVFLKTVNGHKFPPEEYMSYHPAVFIDATSTVNLFADVHLSSLSMLRYDAKKTVDVLNQTSHSDSFFAEVFLKENRHLFARFDVVVRVKLQSAVLPTAAAHLVLDCGSSENALLSFLSTILESGLTDRTQAIAILHSSPAARPISEARPPQLEFIHIGLILSSEHAFRLVDHGPAADSKDTELAIKFRHLWGDKAELRRFKDGRITESVVWEVQTLDERAHIPAMIVRHLLRRHFNLSEEDIHTWQPHFDSMLRVSPSAARILQPSASLAGFQGALSAFDEFVKTLKSLDDELPLALVNVSPISQYLRYTSTFIPLPLPSTSSTKLPNSLRYLPLMEVILEFEKSTKWPDDLEALQNVKMAFCERIATALMQSVKGLKAVVAIGNQQGKLDIQDSVSLEVIMPQGWAFSARLFHDREALLLDRMVGLKARLPHIKKEMPSANNGGEHREAEQAMELYARRFLHAPRHHRAIANLCHRFTAYATTVRLVKRWLACHWLLLGQITEEAAELICASIFIGSGATWAQGFTALHAPQSKERGFFLVIEFLKDWNWDALFVPLHNTQDDSTISSHLIRPVKSNLKKGVWTISTMIDPEGHCWTCDGPDLPAAHRTRALAKATWSILKEMDLTDLDVNTLFAHPVENYDFIISLNPEILPRYYQSAFADSNVWSRNGIPSINDGDSASLRPGFDPARLLFSDLVQTYDNTLKFFHDPFGGDRYGAVWVQNLKQPRSFRVLGGFSSVPTKKESEKSKDKNLIELNFKSVLDEIERMGQGIITKITLS